MSSTEKRFPLVDAEGQGPISPCPPNWEIEEIIYLKVSPVMTADGLSFVFLPKSGIISLKKTSLCDFVQDLLNNRLPTLDKRCKLRNHVPGPLDFGIDNSAYVVVELDRRCAWEFRRDWDGVSVSCQGQDWYAELVHYMPDGTAVPGMGIGGQPGQRRGRTHVRSHPLQFGGGRKQPTVPSFTIP